MKKEDKILLIGIGNSGRADDGLGWAFLDRMRERLPDYIEVEYRYQLQVEDAELASHYDIVIFVDAHKRTFEKGYTWESCYPIATESFTSHALNPSSVLFLSESIYSAKPKSFILGISGFSFQLEIGLSDEGTANLLKACDFFMNKLNLKKKILL